MPAAAATPGRVANMTSMETVQSKHIVCTVVESKQKRRMKIAASEMTHTTDGSVGKMNW